MSSNEDKRIADAIGDTVTPQDVAVVAQRFTGDPTVQVLKYDLGAYSAEKLGFLGCHRQLEVEVKKKNAKNSETIKFFVKSVPYDCQEQSSFINDVGVFAEEYNFFDKVAPQLLENYEGEKFAPVCYLAKPDSLIMEDLRNQNYKMRPSFVNSYPEVKSALSALARLHASCVLAEAKLSKRLKKPTTLKEQYPDCFQEKLFKKDVRSYIWIKAGTEIVDKVGEMSGHDPQQLRAGLLKLWDIVKPSKIHRNVLAHSDLWTNNIMFDDSKPLPKCVLVDFQIVRYGPQALDIVKLLYLHTSRDFREKHEKELVESYYSVFEETIKKKSDLAREAQVPTLRELFAAVNDLRIYGAGMACLYFPLVLMDPAVLQEETKDSESYNNFLFGDRVKKTFDHMEQNEPYKNRIKEAVDEMARLCDSL